MIFGRGDYRTNRIKHVKNMAHGKAGNHGDYRQNNFKHVNNMIHGKDGNHGD